MGGPMAARLAGGGFPVTGCDPHGDEAPAGVELLSSAAAVAARSELVVTSLPGPAEVEEVYLGAEGLLAGAQPNLAAVVDTSTSSPQLARRLARQAATRGVGALDCPVSGGPARAADGTLTMMVGGDRETFAGALPVLEHLATFVAYAGPAGAGQVVKLANNLMTACNMAGLAESLALALSAGIDPGLLFDVVTRSSGDSSVLRRRFPIEGVVPEAPANASFAPLFSLALMRKDVRLALEAADDEGSHELSLARAVLALYDQAAARGWDELDYSVIARLRTT
jgi:3-hydroxyisobutyrate dehydrogenase